MVWLGGGGGWLSGGGSCANIAVDTVEKTLEEWERHDRGDSRRRYSRDGRRQDPRTRILHRTTPGNVLLLSIWEAFFFRT